MNWTELAHRAREYQAAAEILIENNQLQTALEQAHLSVELLMKSAILKSSGIAPKTHNLREIAETKISGKKFLSKQISSTKFIRGDFNTIMSAWDMQDRYRVRELDRYDTEQLIETYRKVYQWIRTNFVD